MVTVEPSSESLSPYSSSSESATVVHYTRGLVHDVVCREASAGGQFISVSSQTYAHRYAENA